MRSIELFAGAGGLGIGLHRAGFHPVQVIEWNRDCCASLRENCDRRMPDVADWQIVESDVRLIDFSPYADRIDLVSGGPPCQPFSMGGKHRAYADTRDMFPEVVRAVREVRPKAFIFENVKGLTRAAFRNYFEYIRLQLEHPDLVALPDEDWADHLARLERHHTSSIRTGLHYRVITRILNAADYGVPQRRERVVFVGFRDNFSADWTFPEATYSLDALLWDQTRGTYWERHHIPQKERVLNPRAMLRAQHLVEQPAALPWRTVRDAICDLPDPELEPDQASRLFNHRHQPGARTYPGHTGSPMDEPAKTLKAGVHGVPGGENMLARANGTVRYFTVRESARLQTFPDDFQFQGAWTEAMRQLGNAVPVELARVVGIHVARRLVSAQPEAVHL